MVLERQVLQQPPDLPRVAQWARMRDTPPPGAQSGSAIVVAAHWLGPDAAAGAFLNLSQQVMCESS